MIPFAHNGLVRGVTVLSGRPVAQGSSAAIIPRFPLRRIASATKPSMCVTSISAAAQ